MTRIYKSPEERFWEKVDKNTPYGPSGECWRWTAGKGTDGYGMFWLNGKTIVAHRVHFFFKNGRWPKDLLCHTCDTPDCVNDAHHFEGTDKDNNDDMQAKGRKVVLRGEQHSFHKLTERNVSEVRALALAGMRRKEIATKFSVKPGYITDILRGTSWKPADKNPVVFPLLSKGESHWNHKLTECDVHQIRKMREAGSRQRVIADRYGVDVETIGDILRRKTWVWLVSEGVND